MTAQKSRAGWTWLDELVGPLDNDFVEAVNKEPEPQERPALDGLFA